MLDGERAVSEKYGLLRHEIGLISQETDYAPESACEAAIELARNPDLVAMTGPTCLSEASSTDPILLDTGFSMLPPFQPDTDGLIYNLFSAIERV